MLRSPIASTLVILLLGTASASAADLVYQFDQPGYDWTGIYVGATVGYTWGEFGIVDDSDLTVVENVEEQGTSAGVLVGYNVQSGNLVFGTEADIAWLGVEGTGLYENAYEYPVSMNWIGTLRGRIGYSFDRVLPYVTAGVAVANADYSVNPVGGPTVISGSDTFLGWTAGAGVEIALDDNWSAKGEYLYSSFQSRFEVPSAISADVDHALHAVRLGVNYGF